jgi:hypothetical protein
LPICGGAEARIVCRGAGRAGSNGACQDARARAGGLARHLDITRIRHHDVVMRTTLTLDPDVAERLERAVRGGGKGLKATVNEALRIGLGMTGKPVAPPAFRIRAFVAGLQPGIDPDKMNQLLDEL